MCHQTVNLSSEKFRDVSKGDILESGGVRQRSKPSLPDTGPGSCKSWQCVKDVITAINIVFVETTVHDTKLRDDK